MRVGQTPNPSTELALKAGSSPRVWGRRECEYGTEPTLRFIPTRVGQTPFVCKLNPQPLGSSPRVRGRLPDRLS